MNLPRAAVVVAVALLLTSCTTATPDAATPSSASPSAVAEKPSSTPSPTPTMHDLASLDDLAGTTWTGKDTQSAVHIVSFKEGGSLRFDSYGDILAFSDDWTATGDTVNYWVAFGPPYGTNDAVGTFDVQAQTITSEFTSRDGLDPFSVVMTQVPYEG